MSDLIIQKLRRYKKIKENDFFSLQIAVSCQILDVISVEMTRRIVNLPEVENQTERRISKYRCFQKRIERRIWT